MLAKFNQQFLYLLLMGIVLYGCGFGAKQFAVQPVTKAESSTPQKKTVTQDHSSDKHTEQFKVTERVAV